MSPFLWLVFEAVSFVVEDNHCFSLLVEPRLNSICLVFCALWCLDRFARNLEDLQRLVRELNSKGVSVQFIKENLTFAANETNPMQTLMFQMLGAFAQFERALIRERQTRRLPPRSSQSFTPSTRRRD